MKLPKRLPYEVLLASALLLGSCSEGSRYVTHDQAVDIADDAASSAIEDSEKIRDLTSRLEAVEERLHMEGQ